MVVYGRIKIVFLTQLGRDKQPCYQTYPYLLSYQKLESDVPGNLNISDIPQMIILTFDSPVNQKNWKLFNDIIFARNRTNPNMCPIVGTFFVSHLNNNYVYIHELWRKRHEIATYSIT